MLTLRPRLLPAAIAFVAAGAAAQQPATTTAATDTMRGRSDTVRADSARAAAPTPAANQPLGLDAEIRVATFELLNDRPLAALGRLQYLSQSPMIMAMPAQQERALRGREDLLFLLSQGYYRFGMDSAFRATAQTVMGSPTAARYAPLLQAQLLLEAYRSGDYQRAIEVARSLAQTEARGLAGLIHGLAHYQQSRWTEARAAFADATTAGAPYAIYAAYMDALAQLRMDTAQTAAALATLQQVAQQATGELADQIRLTAAQLAYEQGRYPEAATLAAGVSESSGLAAGALLLRAWSLYKAEDLRGAGDAFARFASTYPALPERDESRMMYAQVLLQLGRTDEAGGIFRQAMDSLTAEASALDARARLAMGEAATALVRARAAGLLFLADPTAGKTVTLSDAAGSEHAVLAVLADSATRPPEVKAPEVISLADLRQKFEAVQALPESIGQRVFFAPASATAARQQYGRRAQALYEADVALALARHNMNSALEAYRKRLALVERLRAEVGAFADSLARISSNLTAAQDELMRVGVWLDAARVRLRQLFAGQINATRLLADENLAFVDSLRQSIGASATATDTEILNLERATTVAYRAIADETERNLDSAISRHPTFALLDSLRRKDEAVRTALAQAQNSLQSAQAALDDEIARLRAADPTSGALRTALDAAESRRMTAEQALIQVVRNELDSRVNEMVAELRRDAEAAEFGAASVTFFKALDAQRASAAAGTAGSAGAAGEAPTGGSAASQSPRQE